MWPAIGKVIMASVVISFVSWLSGKQTSLAGFLTALPLTTLLALAFSHLEWGNSEQSVKELSARRIFWMQKVNVAEPSPPEHRIQKIRLAPQLLPDCSNSSTLEKSLEEAMM